MIKTDKKLATVHSCIYDTNTRISAFMNDAIELANTPLLERD